MNSWERGHMDCSEMQGEGLGRTVAIKFAFLHGFLLIIKIQ